MVNDGGWRAGGSTVGRIGSAGGGSRGGGEGLRGVGAPSRDGTLMAQGICCGGSIFGAGADGGSGGVGGDGGGGCCAEWCSQRISRGLWPLGVPRFPRADFGFFCFELIRKVTKVDAITRNFGGFSGDSAGRIRTQQIQMVGNGWAMVDTSAIHRSSASRWNPYR
jgi:hypothetical protein